MKPTIKQLVQQTTGMNPQQFEAYCDNNGIQTKWLPPPEWLQVCVSDLNEGFYNVNLPDYNSINVFASYGSAVEFEGY